MATFFGEVLPEFSRIIGDDEDETVNIRNSWKVVHKWGPTIREEIKNTGVVDCQSLIIGVGVIACTFLRDVIPAQSKPIGIISCGLDAIVQNTVGQQNDEDNACFLYRIGTKEHKSIVVLWNHAASAVQQFTVAQELMNSVPSKNLEVVLLTSAHLSTYKCPDPGRFSDTPTVRSLESDATIGSSIFPILEVPNMVTGFPASVLTECQTLNISARLYINYVEEPTPDSINVGAFRPLLGTSPFLHHVQESTINKSMLRPSATQNTTNLYS